MEKDRALFDPSQHSFAAHVRYDGIKLAVHAGPDIDAITTISSTTKDFKEDIAHQIIDTIYYPKEVTFFNTFKQTTLVEPFIQELKARSPKAEGEIFPYISRMLTYGHKIGREIYRDITPLLSYTNSPKKIHSIIEKEIQKERQERVFISKRLEKYQKELMKQFPQICKYFKQESREDDKYKRIEEEELQAELLLFGIENYVKNIVKKDPGFIHNN